MTRTGKLVYDETGEDWSASFGDGIWTAWGGHTQSLGFAFHTLHRLGALPPFDRFFDYRPKDKDNPVPPKVFSIHDYGCACGDGTALLHMAFPGSTVKGFDTAERGVEIARKRWPGISFEVGDVQDPQEDADIIWTSHTIEHTFDAAACVNGLIPRCQVLVVIVPIINETSHAGHEGAETTEAWLDRCPPPIYEDSFNLLRFVPALDVWVSEGSLMFVWQGTKELG